MSGLDSVEDLLRAFAARDLGTIRALADAGLDLDATGGGGLTTLMRAVLRGDSVAVEWILAAGADPDASTADGKTALDFAHALDRQDLIELLSAAGASIKPKLADSADRNESSRLAPGKPRAFERARSSQESQHPGLRSRALVLVDEMPDAYSEYREDRFDDQVLE